MNQNLFNKLSVGNFYDRLFAYMSAVGIQSINVNYSGGGDSGGVDNIEIIPEVSKSISFGITEDCEKDLANPIYNRHGSFADGGGFSVDGSVNYDAVDKVVIIQGTDHNWGDEEDNEGQSEEWEETIYNQEEDDDDIVSDEKDYLFVYLYAKDYLKSRLPEEFHNRMLIEACEQDQYAIRYIEEIK